MLNEASRDGGRAATYEGTRVAKAPSTTDIDGVALAASSCSSASGEGEADQAVFKTAQARGSM